MSDKTFEVTSENFEAEVINASIPVLLDFWAEWCAPCRAIAPIMDDLAAKYEGKLKIGKVDADQHQDIMLRYGVMALPTLLIFNGGEPVSRISGALPKDKMVAKIVDTLNESAGQTLS